MSNDLKKVMQIDFGRSASWANLQSTIGNAGQGGGAGNSSTNNNTGSSTTSNNNSGK